MFGILKQLKQQKEELERIKSRYKTSQDLNNLYCGWTFAYRQTVFDMFCRGEITEEQKNLFYRMAEKYYGIWQNR